MADLFFLLIIHQRLKCQSRHMSNRAHRLKSLTPPFAHTFYHLLIFLFIRPALFFVERCLHHLMVLHSCIQDVFQIVCPWENEQTHLAGDASSLSTVHHAVFILISVTASKPLYKTIITSIFPHSDVVDFTILLQRSTEVGSHAPNCVLFEYVCACIMFTLGLIVIILVCNSGQIQTNIRACKAQKVLHRGRGGGHQEEQGVGFLASWRLGLYLQRGAQVSLTQHNTNPQVHFYAFLY